MLFPGEMSFSLLCYYYVIEIDNVGRFFPLETRGHINMNRLISTPYASTLASQKS